MIIGNTKTIVIIDDKDHALKQVIHEFPGIPKNNLIFRYFDTIISFRAADMEDASIIAANIISSADGYFGNDTVPPLLSKRLRQTNAFFFWPLMSMLWGFDVGAVFSRSLICRWIVKCSTPKEAWEAVTKGRRSLGEKILPIENFPLHEKMRSPEFYNFTTGCVEGDFIEELENVE